METLKLPVSGFRWVPANERKRMTAESILKIPPQDDIGYAFEVDLEYPEHLHKVYINKIDLCPRTCWTNAFFLFDNSGTMNFRWRPTPER